MIIGLRRIINRNDVDYDVDYDYNNGVVESVVLEFQECVRMFQTCNELNVTVLRERQPNNINESVNQQHLTTEVQLK